jgi:hypothetical protein
MCRLTQCIGSNQHDQVANHSVRKSFCQFEQQFSRPHPSGNLCEIIPLGKIGRYLICRFRFSDPKKMSECCELFEKLYTQKTFDAVAACSYRDRPCTFKDRLIERKDEHHHPACKGEADTACGFHFGAPCGICPPSAVVYVMWTLHNKHHRYV